jgi:hypothetical protein
MPASYRTTLKNTRMTAVRDDIDSGTGPGVLQIGTAGMAVVLADITLADPCGTVASGVLTFSGMPRSDTSANATGTAAAARIRDSSGNDIVTGLTVTATGGGGDIQLNSVSISTGQTVEITSASITHAA